MEDIAHIEGCKFNLKLIKQLEIENSNLTDVIALYVDKLTQMDVRVKQLEDKIN